MSPSLLDTCQTLPEILARGAERHPEQVAFTFLGDLGEERARLTFGDLAAVVEDRARRLAARHPTGARLVLALPTGPDFPVSLLAAMRAGLIPVPAPVPRPSGLGIRRLDGIVRSSTASAVITPAAPRTSLYQPRAGSLGGLPLATPEEIGDIEETREPPPVGPGDVAFLQYSSGSTGAPKGIVNLHGTVLANERMLRDAQGHGEGLVAVSWLPLFHDMGLICYLLHTLCVGGHLVAMSPLTFLKRPVRWLQAVSRYGAQSSGAPSSSFGFCVERIDEAERK